MLNVQLRPVTAKWHRAHKAGLLESRDGANAFRADLETVRRGLADFALRLQDMAYGHRQPDTPTPPAIDAAEIRRCFDAVPFGIAEGGVVPGATDINASEALEIAERRAFYKIDTKAGTDAVGLALSGGGIRSATFCLGVVQVLAEKGLMAQVDYLSTVSGGGYTGSVITSRIGGGKQFGDLACPYGPDTEPVRHVRQNAKYLSAADLKERWLLVAGTLAGMMLNWTGPIALLAIAALSTVWIGAGLPAALRYAAVSLGVLTLALLFPYGYMLRHGQSQVALKALAGCGALALLALALLGIEAGYVEAGRALSVPLSTASLAASVVLLPSMLLFLPILRSPQGKRLALQTLTLAAGVAVPLLAVLCYYALRWLAEQHANPGAPWLAPLHYLRGFWLVILGAIVTGLFALFGLDLNATGPHKLYRDALARTFVQSRPGEPDITLSSSNGGHTAPYHLINATVNLPSSRSPVLRDRRSDFFLLSKYWMGSASTGYHATDQWKIGRDAVGLATAMAISGAAASPHMGLGSKPTLAALLTFLNIRLGLWVPRPGTAGERVRTPGFMCLLREMTGLGMSESSTWLNLSDGGHIENMGVYELLRRRTKFIVCVDGEADPGFTFHGQLTLVRHAQIDLGVRLEPRFDDIRLNGGSGYSRSHVQLLRILYPREANRSAAIGLMLYLKLSLTGNEAELLQGYRKLHPDFPHQPTADQFYDEEQFEAYRQLGVHIAEGAFSPALLTSNTAPATIAEWFRQLAESMLEPSTT